MWQPVLGRRPPRTEPRHTTDDHTNYSPFCEPHYPQWGSATGAVSQRKKPTAYGGGLQTNRGKSNLRCALYPITLDAVGANVHTLGFTVNPSANALNVRVETTVGAHVRVRNRLTELRGLSTDVAYRGHKVLLNSYQSSACRSSCGQAPHGLGVTKPTKQLIKISGMWGLATNTSAH